FKTSVNELEFFCFSAGFDLIKPGLFAICKRVLIKQPAVAEDTVQEALLHSCNQLLVWI
ncbi:hypothetical protein PDENDC454_25843, partial [Paenibacillus dendritiformis C454]